MDGTREFAHELMEMYEGIEYRSENVLCRTIYGSAVDVHRELTALKLRNLIQDFINTRVDLNNQFRIKSDTAFYSEIDDEIDTVFQGEMEQVFDHIGRFNLEIKAGVSQ